MWHILDIPVAQAHKKGVRWSNPTIPPGLPIEVMDPQPTAQQLAKSYILKHEHADWSRVWYRYHPDGYYMQDGARYIIWVPSTVPLDM